MKYEITERWGQTFVVGKYACRLIVGRPENDVALTVSEGVGSSCEIARSNAYCELAHKLIALLP